ncbi:MAG TPA: hypothetical protein PK843_14345 [bacterium]|nr:hypothetical protein [bacterium]
MRAVILIVSVLAESLYPFMNHPAVLKPTIRIMPSLHRPEISFLSWDTEGGDQTRLNLLQPGSAIVLSLLQQERLLDALPIRATALKANGSIDYLYMTSPEEQVACHIANAGDRMQWSWRVLTTKNPATTGAHIELPLNPMMTAFTVLPARWLEDGRFTLPAVLSAPDFGQWLVTVQAGTRATGCLTGDRNNHRLRLVLEVGFAGQQEASLFFQPVVIPMPPGVRDKDLWTKVRRGWWNIYQPSAQWGDPNREYSAPAGILSNNVLSDPVSCLYFLFSDQMLLVPQLAPGISAEYLVRHSLEWWLDHRQKANGTVVGYWNYDGMFDAPASMIIAAWACMEASGDLAFVRARIEQLEKIAGYLAARDIDDDGIIELLHSGNAGTASKERMSSAWDTINSGHKDALCNALIFRAFCCLADVERRLLREQQSELYAGLARKLKSAYFRTFYNPTTGLLSWWISADGQVHDYAGLTANSLPISYGLVPMKEAQDILQRYWQKVKKAGFTRLDLGLPTTLLPVRKADYLDCGVLFGAAELEDGSDTFGRYLNGGCLVSETLYWLNACYFAQKPELADPVLRAMVKRQSRPVFANGGSFQNGVINKQPEGAEFYNWQGEVCGYEGYLVYSWSFLQAVLTRQPEYLNRLHGPMFRVK